MSGHCAGFARAAGFTIVELLITVAIIGVLLALLLPALGRGMASARGFRCQVNLRSIAFDFAVFADPGMHDVRGDDEARFGQSRFSLETFVESEYRVDEFWPREQPGSLVTRSSDPNLDTMRCAEVSGEVKSRRNTPCRSGAVLPPQNISFGFNSRLFRIETVDAAGRPRTQEVQLRPDIASRGMVPLAWDIDGAGALAKSVVAVFSAPALNSRGPYANNRFWWPGMRHAGQGNFALIDGSVHASRSPLQQNSWQWAFQPRP